MRFIQLPLVECAFVSWALTCCNTDSSPQVYVLAVDGNIVVRLLISVEWISLPSSSKYLLTSSSSAPVPGILDFAREIHFSFNMLIRLNHWFHGSATGDAHCGCAIVIREKVPRKSNRTMVSASASRTASPFTSGAAALAQWLTLIPMRMEV